MLFLVLIFEEGSFHSPAHFIKGKTGITAIVFLSNCPLVVRQLCEENIAHAIDVESLGNAQSAGTEDQSSKV